MDSTDDFEGLAKLGALFTVEITFKLFYLTELVKGIFILVVFQEEERDVALYFTSFGVHFTVVVAIDLLDQTERIEGIFSQTASVLQFTECHYDLS